MTTCKNCSESFDGNFCPNCGTASHFKRIDKKYIFYELEHSILHIDNGILFTLKELFVRPGKSIRNFIDGEKERIKHFKPLGFLIVTSLLYGFINHYIGYQEASINSDENMVITNWIVENNKYSNIIAIAFIALGLKFVFYRKRNYNLFEYFILMAFITGEILVFGVFAEIISGITQSEIAGDIYLLLLFIYCSWAIGSFFKVKSFWGYLKAFFAYSCCIFFFILTVVLTDTIISALNH